MDIDEIRRVNIRALELEFGGISSLAEKTGMSYTQCLNYRNGVPDSKTGKLRGMRKETAWRFEDACGKPRGWLDQQHLGSGDSYQFSENVLVIMKTLSNMSVPLQAVARIMIDNLAQQERNITEQILNSVPAPDEKVASALPPVPQGDEEDARAKKLMNDPRAKQLLWEIEQKKK